MTVNERLYAAGLLDGWDAAAKSRDRRRMVELLCEVDLLESSRMDFRQNLGKSKILRILISKTANCGPARIASSALETVCPQTRGDE